MTVPLDMDATRDVLMPPGEHRWTAELQTEDGAQTYPLGKEQSFSLKADGDQIVYAFNENDYSGIKFLVKDENGSPANDFRVIVKQDYYEIASTRTDVDGYGTVFLSDPGSYTYEVSGNVSYGNGALLAYIERSYGGRGNVAGNSLIRGIQTSCV